MMTLSGNTHQTRQAIITSLKSEPQTERNAILAETIVAQKNGTSDESVTGIIKRNFLWRFAKELLTLEYEIEFGGKLKAMANKRLVTTQKARRNFSVCARY